MQRGPQQVRTKGICRGGDRRGDVGERPADRRTNSKASQVGVVASRKRPQFLRMAGQTATYNLQVTPSNGFAGTVSLSCTGAPMSALCSVSPPSVAVSGASGTALVVSVSHTSSVLVVPFGEAPGIRTFPIVLGLLALTLILAQSLWRAQRTSTCRGR